LDEYNVDELTAWGLDESIFGIADIDDDDEVLDTSGDDDTPDVPEQPETVLGDVWTLGRHVLVCGDSTEQTTMDKLLNGKLASLVFTDPPYGITYQSNRKVGAGKRFDVLENDDVVLNIVPSMVANSEPNAHWYVWTAQKVAQQWVDQLGDAYTSTIVWSKGGNGMGNLTGGYALNYELALFSNRENKPLNGPREGAVWEIAKDAPQTYKHPTQKPVALSVYAIGKSTRPFEIVLDMFGRSGSTLIGCEKTKRVGRLVELSPKYCDVIVRRWVLFARENGLELNVLLNGEPYDGKLTESENAKG
jgi:DNA modification methylase